MDTSRAELSSLAGAAKPNIVFILADDLGWKDVGYAGAEFFETVASLLFREPLANTFGVEGGIFVLIVALIGITSWMQTARIVRGDVLALKEREFVLAARSVGTSSTQLMIRHLLPNVLSPIMVSATLGIATAIITESALSFLGLGFPPDFPTWGRLLFDGVDYLQQYPERVFWPGLAISLTVLSVNYLGDGLRDALDPRIRGR